MEEASKDDGTTQTTLQFLNITLDTPQASEDDYSVPYEMKIVSAGGNADIFQKSMIFEYCMFVFMIITWFCFVTFIFYF